MQNAERQGKRQHIEEMTEFLTQEQGDLQEYDKPLVRSLIEKITVIDDKLTIECKSCVDIEVKI